MTSFDSLTGVHEFPRKEMYSMVSLRDTQLVTPKGEFEVGQFTLPTVADLRNAVSTTHDVRSNSKISEVVADVNRLHNDGENANAVFQVASQFNCLEMAAPHLVPDDGVGIYEDDLTQGPACSICCGAGTIYRNYFIDLEGQVGQSAERQVNCLSTLGLHWEIESKNFWEMRNGYCFPSKFGLEVIDTQLGSLGEDELNKLRGKLRVGVQSRTEVTTSESRHLVTQVFCSALPIAYSPLMTGSWENFAKLILDATYEATFLVANQNMKETGSNQLFLTLVGGGAFGNRLEWILSAIERAYLPFARSGLDVQIVSYGKSNPSVAELARRLDQGD